MIFFIYVGIILYSAFLNVEPKRELVVYGQVIEKTENNFTLKDMDRSERAAILTTIDDNTLIKKEGSRNIYSLSDINDGESLKVQYKGSITSKEPLAGLAKTITIIQ